MNHRLKKLSRKVVLIKLILVNFLLFGSQVANADVLATKQAFDALTGNAITSVELGQTVEYSFNWNCNFTGTPPLGECGDFVLVDPLPAGVDYVSCSVPGIYSCTYDPTVTPAAPSGTVTIEALDPTRLFTNGESATASIFVEVTTDLTVFSDITDPLVNTAVASSADGDEDVVSSLDINEPTNNWETSKTVLVPQAPLQPALDNDVIYQIEVCPNGPAGLGTGTIIIDNPTLVDACPSGAVVTGATLNGSPVIPTSACPTVAIPLPATFDPADGCQVVQLTLQYPTGAGTPAFAEGVDVTNQVTLGGDNVGSGDCPDGCVAEVTSTLEEAIPGAEISKTAKRGDVAPGAFNRYTIDFDTTNSNVLQTGLEIVDNFPAGMEPIRFTHGGAWSDTSVTANIVELGTGAIIATGYNGDPLGITHTLTAGATGFQVIFTSAVPPGFDGGSFQVNFRAETGLSVGDSFENCVEVSSDQIPSDENPEACATVEIIEPIADLNMTKSMPTNVAPGSAFTTTFDFTQDDTSSNGAVNPVIGDCIPDELEFVSWDTMAFNGLDDPTGAVDTSNTLPRGVAPNFEVLAPGAPGNNCADTSRTLIRWSWQASAPAGSTQLGGSAGVANPFTFPVRRDNDNDDVEDSAGDLGLFVRVRLGVTLRVKPGVLAQTGLENEVQAVPENDEFRCLTSGGAIADENDINDDGSTSDLVCSRVERYAVSSSAAFGGSKFVGGFPGLPNYDPDNPPVDNSTGASTGIVTPASCPVDAEGRTRTPCVAQAMKDQPFDYRIRLSNDGNVVLTDYVAYDILPHTNTSGSDTGISEAQATTVRGSTWVPLLNGPIVLSSADAGVAAELSANAIVEYSASTNPCRPELSIADDTLGGDWQAGSCDDDWTASPLADTTTFPDGYASVRAWRLYVPFSSGWRVGDPADINLEDIIVDLEMLADPTASPSDYESLPDPTLEIAWNNVAFRATNDDTGRRLLSAEAIKTGIVMPPEYPLESTGLRIGNLVWQDANNDGIAQDGEQGIFDVTVQLWQDVTGDGPSADDILFDTMQTDAEGHYLFDDADTDNRDGLGIPAGDYYVAIPSAQTGTFVLADNYSSTTDAPVADDNVDNDDNGAFDSADLLTPVPGFDALYSGTVNLALTDELENETLRNDDGTDDDDDFFDDNDSNVSVDFGFYQLRLGNHVWLDENNNGVADSTEHAIENVLLELFLDDGDGIFDPDIDTSLGTDITDAQGQYLFDGLDVGNYFVAIPAGQTGLAADGTTYSTDQLASSTATSAAGAALGSDNDDDGAPGTYGSLTAVDYTSVSTLLELTVGGAGVNESDSSMDGVNGSTSTDPADANVELQANIDADSAFPDTNSYLTADFGLTPAVSLGSTIWVDTDADGTQDVGEIGIDDVLVTLLDAAGAPILDGAGNQITTTTNADGEYNFNQLAPGTYRVSVDLSGSSLPNIDRYFPSPEQMPDPEDNSNTDSNIDFSADAMPTDQIHISGPIILSFGGEPTGETDPINDNGTGALTDPDMLNQTGLSDNSGNMTLDMGFVTAVSLGSTLWVDDGDGIQESGEAPIVNAEVTLLNGDGSQYDSDPYTTGFQLLTVMTDAQGQYNFNDLPPGDYRIAVDLTDATNTNVTSFIPTYVNQPDANADPLLASTNLDSNIDVDNAANDAATDVWISELVLLSIGQEATGETDPIGSTADDQPNQDLDPAGDPDASGNMTLDLGFIEPVSIGSTVWLDADLDGLQGDDEFGIAGATVALLNSAGAPFDTDPITAGIQNTVMTDAEGQYNFDGLPAGSYFVEVSFPSPSGTLGNLLPTFTQVPGANLDNSNQDSNIATTDNNGTPTDTSDDSYRSELIVLSVGDEPQSEEDAIDADPAGGAVTDQPNQDLSEADPDANGNMTIDFGFYAPVSLGSTIWEDLNGDGTQDLDELPIVNARVTLLNPNGSVFDSDPNTAALEPLFVFTDMNGQYNFDDLIPGSYRVQVDLSSVAGGTGLFPSPVQEPAPDTLGTAGFNNNTDSNIDEAADTDLTDQIYISGEIELMVGDEPAGEVNSIIAGDDQPNQGLTDVEDPDTSGNMTLDMGFVRPVSLGSTIWLDNNTNGVQDDLELPVVNARVTLLDSGGTPVPGVAPVMTDSTGQYNFNGLPPGNYRVQVDLSSVDGGSVLVPTLLQEDDPEDNSNTDSNVDVAFDTDLTDLIHTSGVIELRAGDEPTGEVDLVDGVDGNLPVSDQPNQDADDPDNSGNMTVDMGFFAPVSIGSFVWQDTNGDGTQDSNEPPLEGATVSLLVEISPGVFDRATLIDGEDVTPITVGPDGLYEFDNLPGGVYRVRVTPPAGFFPSPVQNDMQDDNTATDSNIADEPNPGIFESASFTVTPGSAPVEADSDRGDTQDGVADSLDDLSGNMTIDFGFVPPASIGNYVWLDLDMDGVQDANEDGIANVTVNLYEDTDGNGVIDPTELTTPVATVVTGVNGEYLFPDLQPGVVYQTGVDTSTLLTGLVQTYDEGDGVGASDSLSDPIILDPNEEHLTADFGYSPPLGSIGDTVWVDADDDGVQDPGEPGIAGVTVTLTPPADVDVGNGIGVPLVTTTDANGKYLFPNLPLNETYVVTVDEMSLMGYGPSTSGLGDPDVRDGFSDPLDQDSSTVVTLTTELPVNLDADFGYLPDDDNNNSIGDTIWIDADEDGEGPAGANNGADSNELPVPGVTVSLLDSMGVVVATTITDANGQYLFTGLPDGIYTVVVTDQNNVLDGLVQTYDRDDGATGTPTTPNQSVVDLDSGNMNPMSEVNTLQDFGYVSSNTSTGDGAIGDTVFFDENNSNQPDAGEGIEGVTVLLYGPGPDGEIGGGDDILLATTTTDENGNYLFTGLSVDDTGSQPGTDYQVVIDTTTLPNGGAGWINSVDPDTANPGDSTSITPLTAAVPVDLDQDFGYVGAGMNSLSGTVWPDTDGDGEQVESGVFGNVTIELLDDNGNVIGRTTTDPDGNYMFDNLPDGIYVVVVTDDHNVLSGFEHTDSPNGLSDISDRTSKDDTGYRVDLDSSGINPNPVVDVTGDFGYKPTVTNPISLGSFMASKQGKQVRFDWVTQTEVANLGFYLYELVDGDWRSLTTQLILGQGDSTKVAEYTHVANSQSRVFALVDVDATGTETLHGPFMLGQRYGEVSNRQTIDWAIEADEREAKKTQREARKKAAQERRLQEQKQQLNQSQSDDGGVSMWQNNQRSILRSVVSTLLATFISNAQAAEVFEWTNVVTTQAGIHQLDYVDLAAEGVDMSGVDAGTIGLMNQGSFIPIRVTGGDVFGAGSSIQFVAETIDTIYTNENVYTLTTGGAPLRIAQVAVPVNTSTAYASSYLASRKYAPQASYSLTSPDASDPWYAKRMVAIGNNPVSEDFQVTLDNFAPGGNVGSTQAKVRLSVWGASDLPGSGNDHVVAMSFNDEPLGVTAFNGISENTVKRNITAIQDGINTVRLTLPMEAGHAYDAVNVNEIEVQYPRKFVAEDNRLAFTSEFGRFRLTGFTGKGDALVLRQYQGQVEQVSDADTSCNLAEICRVTFGGVNSAADYYVSKNPHKPAIRALPIEQDITSDNANYLIIAHPDFIGDAGDNQLEALQANLLSEMGSVAIVDVEAIYAQFGHYVYDPTAIQRYIAFAHANRGTNYILLVGGDVYDYRQFEIQDAQSFIPSLYAATGNGVMHSPVDALYADINADNVPDIPIARLPVRTNAQLANLLTKRDDYLNRSYAGEVLLVADEYDTVQQYDFGDDADEISQDYLQNYTVTTAYADDLGVSMARAEVINQINQGVTMTSFFGHSSTNQWSFNGLFTGNDAAGLANVGKPTVVTQWGCWNAYYVSPSEDSMGHRFMMEGNHGAVAVMGSSTLTNADSERRLARLVFERLTLGHRLGDAVTQAKQAYAQDYPDDLDVLLGWTILGLPELRVN